MDGEPLILALETSCDESAAAICRGSRQILSSEISSQASIHEEFGGVVPEVASRNHIRAIRPIIALALSKAGVDLGQVDAFAATAGPGLASSLLIGNTAAKALAAATGKPFLAVNHLEGHLLSPFLGDPRGIRSCAALVVSGGHTLLLHLRDFGDYVLMGRTRDDAAGEAFDKVAKLLGLPYPGGPAIDRTAESGDPRAFDFPRSMLAEGLEFSFSGLKTSVRYLLPKLGGQIAERLPDLCASFQEAVVDVLVEKSIRAARQSGERVLAISGGVSCNRRLRAALAERCSGEGIELLIAEPALCTDNAAMIAFAAAERLKRGMTSPLDADVDPNLPLARPAAA